LKSFVMEISLDGGLSVVGHSLDMLGDVCHPEGRFKAAPNFGEALFEADWLPFRVIYACGRHVMPRLWPIMPGPSYKIS
jgi:hypothetical protein